MFEGRGPVFFDPVQEETCGCFQHSQGDYCPSQYSDKFLGESNHIIGDYITSQYRREDGKRTWQEHEATGGCYNLIEVL